MKFFKRDRNSNNNNLSSSAYTAAGHQLVPNRSNIVIVKDDADEKDHRPRTPASPAVSVRRNKAADQQNADLSQLIETLIPPVADVPGKHKPLSIDQKSQLSSSPTPLKSAAGNLFVNPNAFDGEEQRVTSPSPSETARKEAEREKVSKLNFASTIYGIILSLLDIVSDFFVAAYYYANGDLYYFGWTVLFTVVPGIIMSITSAIWYSQDYFHSEETACDCCVQKWVKKYNRTYWPQRILRIVCHVILMAPILREVEALYYSIRARRSRNRCLKENLHVRAFYAERDASVLRLFEAFLEDLPQMILQLYIVSTSGEAEIEELHDLLDFRIINIFIGWISVTFTLVAFHRDLAPVDGSWTKRVQGQDMLIQFFWQFLFIGSRVFAIVAVSLHFPDFITAAVLLHCVAMIFLIIRNAPSRFSANSINNKCAKLIYSFSMGFIFTFCFFNVFAKKSLRFYLLYYAITVPQNIAGMVFYYVYHQVVGRLFIAGCIIGATFLSLFVQALYYYAWHPKRGQCRTRREEGDLPPSVAHERERLRQKKGAAAEDVVRRDSLFVEWPMHLSGYNSHCFCCSFRQRGLLPQSPRPTFLYKRGAPF